MTRITVAKGDGIGPEIMDATLSIIRAAGARIEVDEIEVGEKVYLSGNTSGIAPECLGYHPPQQDFPESAHHHAAGRGLQESECYDPQIPRSVLKRTPVHEPFSVCEHQTPGDGRDYRARE
jgi:hypothetical protein